MTPSKCNMNTLFLLFATLGFVNADIPVPDELKNHFRLVVTQYNTSGCSVQPYNTSYVVQQCQENGTSLPYCCVTMLRSLSFVGDENSFEMCHEGGNDTSYFASCDNYYTESQVETGKIFGYVVLGMGIFLALFLIVFFIKRCCCTNSDGYGQIN